MSVKEILINTIKTKYDYPIFLQGSIADDTPYPDNFFTFFNNSTTDDNFYNNAETLTEWDIDLYFYSNDPTKVNTVLKELKQPLKDNGFTVDGVGFDALSDEPTHTGRGIELIYIERT